MKQPELLRVPVDEKRTKSLTAPTEMTALARAYSEENWAPGPYGWDVSAFVDRTGATNAYVLSSDGKKLAAVWGKREERFATAALLAAAPTMYDLLIDILDDGRVDRSRIEQTLAVARGESAENAKLPEDPVQQQMIQDAMKAIAERKPGRSKLVYDKTKRTIVAVANQDKSHG